MADDKKYYYLKLKDNFFDSEKLIVLENMQDGYLYSNILLKLYLRSLKGEGRLMFNERIPYSPTLLSQITRHPVGVIEKALTIFREFELIDVMDNGAIYMMDIQNYIGHSSTEADRQREYQRKLKDAEGSDTKLLGVPCKEQRKKSNKIPTPEIIDKSLESKAKAIEKPKELKTFLPDSIEYRASEYLLGKILSNNPEYKKPNIQLWAKEFDLMIRIDNRSHSDIGKVIDFCQSDPFWKSNILSPKKLREKFDALTIKMKNQPTHQHKKGSIEELTEIVNSDHIQRFLRGGE